jgi:hypothetical protein
MAGWLRLLLVSALTAGALASARADPPAPAPAPTPPPAPAAPGAVAPEPLPTTGTLTGVITARSSGKPLNGVKVTAGGKTTTTDAAGRFSLELPPGDYEVRLASLAYQPTVLKGPHVEAGATTTVNASLNPAVVARSSANLDVIEVYGEVTRASESTQISRRLEAAAVSEAVSAETIRKLPGGDVAAVAKRVPSVTIFETQDGEKIICVRGLCSRYTIGLVDGALLPSTNPVRRLVPAEIFPPEFLDSLVVYKSFLPDLRGNFAGAQVEFELRDPPEVLTYNMSATVGANTQTTFQEFNTYDGSRGDWVTLGNAKRSAPKDLPSDSVDNLPERQQFALARQFENVWDVDSYDAPPDFGAKFSVGNTVGPFGYLLGGLYKNEWRAREEFQQTLQNTGTTDDPDVEPRDRFPQVERDRFVSRLAGFLSTALYLPDDHKVNFTSFVSRRALDETTTQVASPENGGVVTQLNPDQTQIQNRLKYFEDQVAFGELRGTHPFGWIDATWRSAISLSSRKEPDTRHTTFRNSGPGTPLLFSQDSLGGLRIFNDTQEWLSDTGLDLTVPFDTRLPGTKVWSGLPAKLKGGWNYSYRDRNFVQRRFEFIADGATQNLARDPEFLFSPGQIGPGGSSLTETTQPTDSFHASEAILAGYGMLELPIIRDTLRAVGGVRYEHALIDLDTVVFADDQFCAPGESICDVTISRDEGNLLPGMSLIYTPQSDMNLRFSFSKTVSRPDFRELAPTFFPAQRGELAQIGNPDLVQSDWTNYDLRYEWLPSAEDVLSAGVFWKKGTDAIERTEIPAAQATQTWLNAELTKILGLEFEGRKNMGFLGDEFRNLNLSANVTYFPYKTADIPVAIVGGLETVQTETKRDPADVPNFIVNAAVEYTVPDIMTARALYTTVGPTLIRAGAQGLPDSFQEREDIVDIILQFPLQRWTNMPLTLQIGAENILNDDVIQTQGDFTVSQYTRGVTVGMSITYSPPAP